MDGRFFDVPPAPWFLVSVLHRIDQCEVFYTVHEAQILIEHIRNHHHAQWPHRTLVIACQRLCPSARWPQTNDAILVSLSQSNTVAYSHRQASYTSMAVGV